MTTKVREFKGHHLAIMMVCFFGVIVTVNFTMAYIAMTNWTGLVVKNSYVASQKFNGELAAAEAQRARGWYSSLSYQNGELTVSLKDAGGAALETTALSAKIGRPAFEQLDHDVVFTADQDGFYRAEDALEPGLWAVSLRGEVDGQAYRRDLRLFVSEDGTGVLE